MRYRREKPRCGTQSRHQRGNDVVLGSVLDIIAEGSRKRMGRGGIVLLHDNACPLVTMCTHKLLQSFRQSWEVFGHPANSPDLAPSDYHLFQN
ncbi:hypothetical protein AVEN_272436-1 [Araneus ventricosus]|uniref:Uncharacterized protein n=1 Tax=Araneus ventricosus TaxID=182803 RepID=A0A4Y2LJW5_ARAVE|nr:hypothetical protein AVEN_272436-1 [Araneus ventricosus]